MFNCRGFRHSFAAAGLALFATTLVRADMPHRTYPAAERLQIISPPMGAADHNQPVVVNGQLLLAGNAVHSFWDIADPYRPTEISTLTSPHGDGEAESHQVSWMTDGARHFLATISGRGIDLWEVTDVDAPELLSALELPGVDYGDNSEAVWGVAWQGSHVFVGGTNTGLHVVDASDPRAPLVVAHLTIAELGGVSAGPLFAMGNLLVVTTPKNHAGVATVDISAPDAPALLDFVRPETESYIGGFYGRHAYLVSPLRAYDVTSDPSSIELVGTTETAESEYLSFADGRLFLGLLRPDPGIVRFDLSDPAHPVRLDKIEGRRDFFGGAFTDDQFSMPIGNLLVVSDDEVDIGSVIAVQETARDAQPPEVLHVRPADGGTNLPTSSRVGIAFSDHLDVRTLDPSTFAVRPVDGEALPGRFGVSDTVVNFWPDAPLLPDTRYEVVLRGGGVRDLVGNAIASEFRSVFSTGDDATVTPCGMAPPVPALVGAPVEFSAGPVADATYTWRFGDGAEAGPLDTPGVTHTYDAPGRYAVVLRVVGPAGPRSCSASQIVTHPPTEGLPTASSTLVYDAARSRVWTVHPDADALGSIDATAWTSSLPLSVGRTPNAVALVPSTGELWVACTGDDTLSIVGDAAVDGAPAESITLRYGAAPIAVVAHGDSVWVATRGTSQLIEFDAASRSERRRVDLPAPAHHLAVRHDGARIYAARFLSPDDRGEVYVLDAAGGTLETISLRRGLGPDAADGGRGTPNLLGALQISPDGRSLFVPSASHNLERGIARDGLALNTDNTVRAIVSAIDLESGREREAARMDLDDHEGPSAVAFSPRGDVLFVATRGTHRVDAFDVATGRVLANFGTAFTPDGLVVVGDHMFVKGFLARAIAVHDVSGLLSGADGVVRAVTEVVTLDAEPLDPQVLAGKRIFHDAASRRMSLDGYVACSSCHPGGGHDARTWDFTDRGEGVRNTIDLRGRRGTGHGPVHWTANFDEIQDFENDIRAHFGGNGFLSNEDWLADDRSDPLGAPKAGLSDALDALAAYVGSLDEFARSPHRTPDGAMTEAALRGRATFESLQCRTCHAGERLTDSGSVGARLHEVGTLSAASGQRRGGPLAGFDTPTLRGLFDGAPYFHDGSAATLDEVLLRPGHGDAHALSDAERGDLVAFLLSIDNDDFGYPEPMEPVDAGCDVDAGGCVEPPADSAGCGCAVPSGEGPAGWGWGVGLGLLGFWVRRRRHRDPFRS